MAHFAQIDENNKVVQVVVIDNAQLLDENGNESEAKGIAFCNAIFGGTWLQTSYNHNFRHKFAGIDDTYDAERNAFIPPSPFPSWILNQNNKWTPPVPSPVDENGIVLPDLKWDEETVSWIQVPSVDEVD